MHTLGNVYDKLKFHIPDLDDRWTTDQQAEAIKRAHLLCRPLGLRRVVEATLGSSEDEFTFTETLTLPIERCRLGTTFRGVMQWQQISIASLRSSIDENGVTTFRLPLPASAGSRLQVTAIVLPNLPEDPGQALGFTWIDVLVSYTVAELYGQLQDHGATLDITQFQQLHMSWTMRANELKQQYMTALGLSMPMDDEPKPKSKSSDRTTKRD